MAGRTLRLARKGSSWRYLGRVCLAGIVLGSAFLVAPQEEDRAEIMWRKLDLAHEVLDAIVLEDFEALEAYAEDLEMMGLAGERFTLDTEAYRTRSAEFRRAARTLLAASRRQDVEAAALANLELTLTCLGCHRSLGVLPR